MSGRTSRTKGASAERELCTLLRPTFPSVQRHLEQCRSRSGLDLSGCEPWCPQVKRRRAVTPGVVAAGLAEAQREIGRDGLRWAVVLHRSDRQPWRATLTLHDLVDALGLSTAEIPEVVVDLSLEAWLDVVRVTP